MIVWFTSLVTLTTKNLRGISMKKMPGWIEKLIVKAIKDFVPVSVIIEALEAFKVQMIAKLRELAASTENKIDDIMVDKIEETLSSCNPDVDFLCGLIKEGEDYLIVFLRNAVSKSETKIDDAIVDLVEEALRA